MKVTKFTSFFRTCNGRVITEVRPRGGYGYVVIQARNPYGGHNLVLVDAENGEALRHGNKAVLNWASAFPNKQYRKVLRYVSK